jgi:hypothetical protein
MGDLAGSVVAAVLPAATTEFAGRGPGSRIGSGRHS